MNRTVNNLQQQLTAERRALEFYASAIAEPLEPPQQPPQQPPKRCIGCGALVPDGAAPPCGH